MVKWIVCAQSRKYYCLINVEVLINLLDVILNKIKCLNLSLYFNIHKQENKLSNKCLIFKINILNKIEYSAYSIK